jgi:WD40 repeat protein
MRSTCPSPQELEHLLAGRLSPLEDADVSSHIQSCPACQQTLQQLTDPAPDDLFGHADPQVARCNGSGESTFRWSRLSRPQLLSPAEPAPLPVVPGYEVLDEIGRGGMGVIYRARHLGLDRVVALKMIAAGSAPGEYALARFRTEVAAVARLRHPHIVQVHDAGEVHGQPYLSLEYVAGGSLKDHLDGTPLRPADAAGLVETLARAMHHAHQAGIVHRDLKPANVLLSAACGLALAASEEASAKPQAAMPKITDFGLAKLLDGSGTLRTQSGEVVGTPSYMAPEQTGHSIEPPGPACDVYALGAILYELLTGRPPFNAQTPLQTMLQVAYSEPVSVTGLQPGTPRDLATIAMKCLEKDPDSRYASAADLADDLRRFLDGRPIRARRASLWERARKWARRHPAVAGLTAAVVLVTALGVGLAGWQWYEAAAARRVADQRAEKEKEAHGEANRERRRAEVLSASLALDQGLRICQEGQVAPGLLWMARALDLLPEEEDADLDYTIRANLTAWKSQLWSPRPSPPHGTAVVAVAFAPDGKSVLTGDWGNHLGTPGPARAQLWDAETWKPLLPRPVEHPSAILVVAFGRDGRVFATASLDGTARLWETRTGRPVARTLRHVGPVHALAFRPDGQALATASGALVPVGDGQTLVPGCAVRVWDAATGKPLGEPMTHPLLPTSLAWAPDGQTLALGGRLLEIDPARKEPATEVGGEVVVLDPATGQVRDKPLRLTEPIHALAFSPDGQALVTGGDDRDVRFWDARRLKRLGKPLRHDFPVRALAFSRDGRTLATGSGERLGERQGPGEARLWDVATGRPLCRPLIHQVEQQENTVLAVALNPDGNRLATASENGRACVWPVPRPTTPVAALSVGPISRMAFSRDGSLLALSRVAPDNHPGAEPSTEIHLYRVQDLVEGGATGPRVVLPLTKPQTLWAVSPDGTKVLTLRAGEPLRLWDAGTRKALPLPAGLAAGVSWADFSPDGKRLLTGGGDGKLRLWDLATLALLGSPLDHTAAVQRVGLSPDGQRAFSVGADRRVRLWSLPQHEPVGEPLAFKDQHPGEVTFSADGHTLLVAWHDPPTCKTSLALTRTADARPIAPPREVGICMSFAGLHPRGRSLLTTSCEVLFGGPEARVWDGHSGEPLTAPLPLGSSVTMQGGGAFHPSGHCLVLAGREPTAQLWGSQLTQRIGPALPHSGPVREVVFHPAGALLATAGGADGVRLWKIPRPLPGRARDIKRLIEVHTGQELDRAGAVRALSAKELEQRRRRLGGTGVAWPS